MQPPRFGPYGLGDGGSEGKYVMPGLCFDLVYALDREGGFLLQNFSGRGGYDACTSKCRSGGKFNTQPVVEPLLF